MRIGIIIPDRGDRPQFLKKCIEMILTQTIFGEDTQAMQLSGGGKMLISNGNTVYINIVGFEPSSEDCDITERYRMGYHSMRHCDLDVIFLIENDDFYSSDYMEVMLKMWEGNGRPDIFGLDHTIYYHVGIRKYFEFKHKIRSSAMNTMIKPNLEFPWCADNYAYTDIHLWSTIKKGVIVTPPKEICLGIKHGIGKSGGRYHSDQFEKYIHDDSYYLYLKNIVDPESLEFYQSLSN